MMRWRIEALKGRNLRRMRLAIEDSALAGL